MTPLNTDQHDIADELLGLRFQNPAWQLLASRRAPLILACLVRLFTARDDSLPTDVIEQGVAEMLLSTRISRGESRFKALGDLRALPRWQQLPVVRHDRAG